MSNTFKLRGLVTKSVKLKSNTLPMFFTHFTELEEISFVTDGFKFVIHSRSTGCLIFLF